MRLAAALAVLLLLTAGAGAQTLEELDATRRSLTRAIASFDMAIERQRAENAALVEELDGYGAGAGASATLDQLRQAQFEVDIARTRLIALDSRFEQQAESIRDLEAAIAEAAARLAERPDDTLAAIVAAARQELREASHALAVELQAKLRTFRELSAEALGLHVERLDVLRQHVALDSIEGVSGHDEDPIVRRLRGLVVTIGEETLRLSNEAARIEPVTPADAHRKTLLRLRSDESLLRINARLNDIVIVEARRVGEALERLVDDPAIPVRLFVEADELIDELDGRLAARAATLGDIREAVADIRRIAEGSGPAAEPEAAGLLVRLDDLGSLVDAQEADLGRERERLGRLGTSLEREIGERRRLALATRDAARLDPAAQRRIATDLAALPAAIGDRLAAIRDEVRGRVAAAARGTLALAGLGALAIVLVTLVLRQRLLPRFVAHGGTQATAVPVEVVRRNLLWLLPAALWTFLAYAFAVPWPTVEFVAMLLLIPAGAVFVRDFVQIVVAARGDGEQRRIGRLITRLTGLAVILIALLAFAYLLVSSVFLLPSTAAWIGRAIYGALVIAAVPLVLFAWYFAVAPSEGRMRTARRVVYALASLLAPAALVGIGVTGIVGYTALATELFLDLVQVITILAALALALGVLHDVVEGYAAHLRGQDPARAYFWRRNFLDPAKRLAQAILIAVAAWVILAFFAWGTDTPVVREVVAFFSFRLFRFGETDYTVARLLLAILALFVVFWIGGWSRRVSYSLVYLKVRDIGVRQSLSVFTQYAVVVVGLLLALSAIGFDVTTLTVFAASLGVGIGFGMQNVVNNFISGLLLLVERPLRLGDIVTVAGQTGTVEQIGIRSLRLRTFDEFDVIVPNSAVISDTFTNWSRTDKVIRQLISVGISYGDDPRQAVAIIRGIVENFEPILKTPAPMVSADEFADSSINIRIAYYIVLGGPVGVFDIRNHVVQSIWEAFREAGITIPFPQRDVHVVGGPPGEAAKALFAPGEAGAGLPPGAGAGAAAADRRRRLADAVESVGEAQADEPDAGR